MKFWRWGSPSISDSSSKVYIFWSRRNQNQKINITDSLEGIGRSYLIWHLSKNPFKNRFFATSYSYPQRGVHTHNRDCECPAPRIRVACSKEAVLKGGLRRVSYKNDSTIDLLKMWKINGNMSIYFSLFFSVLYSSVILFELISIEQISGILISIYDIKIRWFCKKIFC